MLNTLRRLSTTTTVNQICKRCQSSVAPQSTEGEESIAGKWQLFVSACITRPPMLSASLSNVEERFKEVTMAKEVEQSFLCEHEIRVMEEEVRAKALKDKKVQENINQTVKETMIEIEDAWAAEYDKFSFPSNLTEADKTGDNNSLYRALDRSLVLVCPLQLGKLDQLCFPQITWSQGESLRQTCDRLVKKDLNNALKVKIFDNAPCGFYNYKYSKALRARVGFIGAKVFFYSGHVTNTDLNVLKDIRQEGYLWLTHDQLGDKLQRAYHNAVKQFLISDN